MIDFADAAEIPRGPTRRMCPDLRHVLFVFVAGWIAAYAPTVASADPSADQSHLVPVSGGGKEFLKYDWPILNVGTAEYTEGPTGATVFHFLEKVYVAIDSRGGGPGTVNADYLELNYDYPWLDTIVFAGGSWYGLEAVTAVASALKDDGIRDGDGFSENPNIALSVGSIIFDFGPRRLNEIYPDKRLAQAAFRSAASGRFAQGPWGAGRFAKSGGFFGCNAYSGQGGAYRELGEVKLAAFVVVNAVGVVTDRSGDIVACYPDSAWGERHKTRDLLVDFPAIRNPDPAARALDDRHRNGNTTISLIVTNLKMPPAMLQRFAVQVHTSMGRAIQPFATEYDGDVLYAVSTAEIDNAPILIPDLGVVAAEVMWDAILASTPDQPQPEEPAATNPAPRQLASFAGTYRFSKFVDVRVFAEEGGLFAQADGARDAYAIRRDNPTELEPLSTRRFTVPGRYPLVLEFPSDDELVINPGHWEQVGKRIN